MREEDVAHLARARQALRQATAVVPHTDADGLAAHVERDDPGARLPDGALAVLDWGVRPLDRPALIVDRHAPEAAPRDDQVVVTSYGVP